MLICPALIFVGCEETALGQAIAPTETAIQASSTSAEANAKTAADSPAVAPQLPPPAKPAYSRKASDLGSVFVLDRSTIVPQHDISQIDTQQPEQPKNSPPNKNQYNLFNPTPRELWRELTTDRPDRTESPYTVDAGAFQVETDLFVYTRDTNNPEGTRTESFDTFIPNFKIGLTNNIDFQSFQKCTELCELDQKAVRLKKSLALVI
ncbi:MAG: transporter [Leptolyngbyaceae cyanobacterium bins.302]|nr:transporter [Leptolyngbyaceae cyanobacterium bins.302]